MLCTVKYTHTEAQSAFHLNKFKTLSTEICLQVAKSEKAVKEKSALTHFIIKEVIQFRHINKYDIYLIFVQNMLKIVSCHCVPLL